MSTSPTTSPSEETLQYDAQGSEFFARFHNGTTAKVVRGRIRSYPGLPGAAPPTGALYKRLINATSQIRGLAVDIGCGAGLGTRMILEERPVIGLDNDRDAIAFTKGFIPSEIQLITENAMSYSLDEPVEIAYIVDLLGLVTAPFDVLRRTREQLSPTGRIAIAEPCAYPAQHLRAPARRAFSTRSISTLLFAAGFENIEWVESSGTFIACTARVSFDAAWQSLMEGAEYAANNRYADADRAYQLAMRTERRELQVEGLLCRAELAIAQGDGDGACQAFIDARDLDDTDPRPMAGIARLMLQTGETGDALLLAKRAIDLDPTEVGPTCILAMAAEQMSGNRAIELWRVASHLAPDDFAIAVKYSEAASGMGEHEQAIFTLERLKAYDDHGPALSVALASVLRSAGRIADARLQARVALMQSPNDPDVQRLWDELSATPA